MRYFFLLGGILLRLHRAGPLPDPANVGGERARQLVRALLKTCGIVEEDEIELGQLFREGRIFDRSEDYGRQALVERGRERDLFERNRAWPHRIGAEQEHDRV